MATTEFKGFARPTRNYFPVSADAWAKLCEIDNFAEQSVVMYVIGHTWRYGEYGVPKTISVDEFLYGRRRADGTRMDEGAGLKSDRSVRDGINLAIKHGYLICEVDYSDKARVKKSYALKMLPGQEEETTLVDATTPTQNTAVVDSTSRSEKDTSRKTSEKDTQEKLVVTEHQRLLTHTEEVLTAAQQLQKDSYSHQVKLSSSDNGYRNQSDQLSEKAPVTTNASNLAIFFSVFEFAQTWTIEAVDSLAKHILPPYLLVELDRQDTVRQAYQTGVQGLYFSRALEERGFLYLARLLCFESDPASPVKFHIRRLKDPIKEIGLRLLSLSSGMPYKACQELDSSAWWPAYLPTDQLPPGLSLIDLAALAGIDQENRQGFGRDELDEWYRKLSPWSDAGYEIAERVVADFGHGGFSLEIWPPADTPGCVVRFYSEEHYTLLQQAEKEADGGFGSPDFIAYLANALRQGAKEKVGIG